jgi:hypothetical protein
MLGLREESLSTLENHFTQDRSMMSVTLVQTITQKQDDGPIVIEFFRESIPDRPREYLFFVNYSSKKENATRSFGLDAYTAKEFYYSMIGMFHLEGYGITSMTNKYKNKNEDYKVLDKYPIPIHYTDLE